MVTGCIFTRDEAPGGGTDSGGAILNLSLAANVYITGCTFTNNVASYDGGASRMTFMGALSFLCTSPGVRSPITRRATTAMLL